VYTHRELVGILVAKQLKLRYCGSGLGFLWTLLNPLLQMESFSP
jgi:ABC-type polysaccharide/polyol phosphate export permease